MWTVMVTGWTRKTHAQRTGTPVTLHRGRIIAAGRYRSRGDRKCSSGTGSPPRQRMTHTHVSRSVATTLKVASLYYYFHGLRVQQYGRPRRRRWPSSCRQGTVLAVHGTAFQRRSNATAQRQLLARLRKLGYVMFYTTNTL